MKMAYMFHVKHIRLFFVENNRCNVLTESSKSLDSIAKSNKQWVGTCLYQEGYKPLLINCEAVIRCRAT